METNLVASKLNKLAPETVLEKRRFGRSEQLSVWVELKSLSSLAGALKQDPELQLDWLEHLSAMQLDDAIILSYFLRSSSTRATLVVRASIVPRKSGAEIEAPSVISLWPTADPMEQELEEMFGIRFTNKARSRQRKTIFRRRELTDSSGPDRFPLRKPVRA